MVLHQPSLFWIYKNLSEQGSVLGVAKSSQQTDQG